MNTEDRLSAVLRPHLSFHKARVDFIAQFVLALLKVRTVNCAQIAVALNGRSKVDSNRRRIERFLAFFDFDLDAVARLTLRLAPWQESYVVSIDRTEWQFGSRWINILFAGVVCKGRTFPLVWTVLGGRGCSDTCLRVSFIERILNVLPKERIDALGADREFIGHDWFRWLDKNGIPFYIRVKQDALVASKNKLVQIHRLFTDLKIGQARRIGRRRAVYGNKLWVTGLRTKDEFLIVAANRDDTLALEYYRQRWGIETLFGALKTRGFDFESTHIKHDERIEKLIGLLSLAYLWASLVGLWLQTTQPLKVKRHGRLPQSVFRRGLDHLRAAALGIACAGNRAAMRIGLDALRTRSRIYRQLAADDAPRRL